MAYRVFTGCRLRAVAACLTLRRAFRFQALRYIGPMSTDPPGTTYIVTAYDSEAKIRKTVLSTKDKAEAEWMVEAMKQDGVPAEIEKFPPRKR